MKDYTKLVTYNNDNSCQTVLSKWPAVLPSNPLRIMYSWQKYFACILENIHHILTKSFVAGTRHFKVVFCNSSRGMTSEEFVLENTKIPGDESYINNIFNLFVKLANNAENTMLHETWLAQYFHRANQISYNIDWFGSVESRKMKKPWKSGVL